MKICMVSDVYYPYVGGIPEHIFHLSQQLRQRGHTVKILTSNFGGTTVETLKACPDEEHIFRIGQALLIRSNKSFARLPIGWRPMNQVKRFLEQENFDLIHIHGSLAPTLPIIAIRQSKTVNVITFHSDHSKSKGYLIFRQLLMPYFRKLHGLIAVSAAARDSTMRFFPGDYQVIPNAIDNGLFNPSVAPLQQFSDSRPKILFLGRFEPRKGLKYLLKALPYIKNEIPNVLLIVVGAGLLGYAYKEYIAKEVEENIHFAGLIPNEERPKYYATCDVYCAPSIGFESFGIVLLEAMATSKPVVASDIPGYRTILEDGKQGYLAPPRDYEAIAQSIVKILRDPQLAKKMGEEGRKKALKYSWENIAQQVEAYYEELLSHHHRNSRGVSFHIESNELSAAETQTAGIGNQPKSLITQLRQPILDETDSSITKHQKILSKK
jgi:phosphatidylinositol alpha-mannosyltransferase